MRLKISLGPHTRMQRRHAAALGLAAGVMDSMPQGVTCGS
jgi:hypothetical protein